MFERTGVLEGYCFICHDFIPFPAAACSWLPRRLGLDFRSAALPQLDWSRAPRAPALLAPGPKAELPKTRAIERRDFSVLMGLFGTQVMRRRQARVETSSPTVVSSGISKLQLFPFPTAALA
jgi:hypothetical protein